MRLTTSCKSFALSKNLATFFFSNKARDRFSISSKELNTGLEWVAKSMVAFTWRVHHAASAPQNQRQL